MNPYGRVMGAEGTLVGAGWGADRWGENRTSIENSSLFTRYYCSICYIFTLIFEIALRYFFRGAFPDQPTFTFARSQSSVSLPMKPWSKAMAIYRFVWLFYPCHSLLLPVEVPQKWVLGQLLLTIVSQNVVQNWHLVGTHWFYWKRK